MRETASQTLLSKDRSITQYRWELQDCAGLRGPAGDLRFDNDMLELDKTGNGTADLTLLSPGAQSIKGANLIL